MTTPDVHALTGAYVLDAVPELERAAFERHLSQCDACTQEVRELRETATRLGRAAAAEPPPWLRSQVLARISEVRQLPPEPGLLTGGQPRTPGWALRLTTVAAAVLLVASVVLGVLLVNTQNDVRDAEQYAASLSAILQAPDAAVANGAVQGGGTAVVVSSRERNEALLLANGLSDPGGGVYQAWKLGDGDPKSAGLLDGNRLDIDGLDQATSIGLTKEPAGGSTTPTAPVLVTVDLL
ncbi:anti-sigma factor [Actinophytocola sp.]|uniref:anti-sigma factor n=1 Tax=Actinophytocola sp. TaxID=1872138 RepID=UPI002D7E1CA1|nr:anti-sigma factor [Actinophytocola sp.]HET9140791.1 anti-sigma factor [Actinophytocola sp.]HEU5106981.1 anti-sigma factor [Micromonosporaceae bacterium]